MIRRLVSVLVAGYCLLSLLASLGTGWLWWRSYRVGDHRVSRAVRGDRYTMTSRAGRVTLAGPPPRPTSPEARRAVDDLAGRLRNDQIVWRPWPAPPAAEREFTFAIGYPPDLMTLYPRPGSAAAALAGAGRGPVAADARAALLAALEDPERFVAAHVLLTAPTAFTGRHHWGSDGFRESADGQTARTAYNGMWVELHRPTGPPRPASGPPFECGVSVDAAQLPLVRDAWHRALDVTVFSAPHWLLLLAAALPPAAWLGGRARRTVVLRGRRRRGLCARCGYDLRGSPPGGRCSECGDVTGAKGWGLPPAGRDSP